MHHKTFEFEIKCLHLCFIGGIVCISSIKIYLRDKNMEFYIMTNFTFDGAQ